jgi:hypothetical protein
MQRGAPPIQPEGGVAAWTSSSSSVAPARAVESARGALDR